jgi:1A family penicillin-binding protein
VRQKLLIATLLTVTAVCWYVAYRTVKFTVAVAAELDIADQLSNLTPRSQATVVMDRRGKPAFAYFAERRIEVPLEQISPHMLTAIVAVEDRRFYEHHGLDPVRIIAAGYRNVRAGQIRQGASTITQQLARAARLSPVRTFERKLREALIALRIEERYSKGQILQEYLNTVYFGEGLYGVEVAANGYFGKSAAELSPSESALLAGLVRAPSKDSPCASPDRAIKRRNFVLRLMREQGVISDAELQSSLQASVPTEVRRGFVQTASGHGGGYFQEEVRRQLMAKFGVEKVLRGGLRVYSSYDPDLQRAGEEAIRFRIAQIVKARSRAKDLQGSLVAMDPTTGDVLALVGGRNFAESPYNRATQARRQAGSAFKPIIYAAALERGYAPGSMLRDLDAPIATSGWMPTGEHERSEYTVRNALKVSSNRAAAQVMQQVGMGTTIYYARRLGIQSTLPQVPSLALGTGEVTLLELTSAYGVFANQGLHIAPRLFSRVEDSDGRLIWTAPVDSTRAISRATAFLMSSMLSDVITGGTATGARAAGFTLPSGGKTGTTDDYADAWFVGYTPHLVAGVWFGLDTPAPIMDRGFAGTVAVPAWARFMKAATDGAKADWYDVPPDVEKVSICRLSGMRAGEGCTHATPPEEEEALPVPVPTDGQAYLMPPVEQLAPRPLPPPVYTDYFPIGMVPAEVCPYHRAGTIASAEDSLLPMPAASSAPAAITIERVPRADGTMGIVLKGGSHQ